MGGLVKPEEFDYFHEVYRISNSTSAPPRSIFFKLIITQEFARASLRGYGDGELAERYRHWFL
jgi:hypothetical protein